MPSIVVGIWLTPNWFKPVTYNVLTKEETTGEYESSRRIKDYIKKIRDKYKNTSRKDKYKITLRKIVIYDPDEQLDRSNYFEKYGDLLYFSSKEEIMSKMYFSPLIKFTKEDKILVFLSNNYVCLYKCTNIAGQLMTLKEEEHRYFGQSQESAVADVIKEFELEDNIHIAINEKEGKKLYEEVKEKFPNTVYIKTCDSTILIARILIGDPDIQYFIKIDYQSKEKTNYINDCGVIHIPKPVKEYESQADTMGIDIGSTRCKLAISKNRETEPIPFDSSSSGTLYTASVVSFDEEETVFGTAAEQRMRTNSGCVLFDMKVFTSGSYKYLRGDWTKDVLPFNFSIDNNGEFHYKTMTVNGERTVTTAEFNEIFLKKMKEAATEYQPKNGSNEPVCKAVFTIPRYFKLLWSDEPSEQDTYIDNIIKAAKLADIEIIDIIEETHADLLYYLSHDEYSKEIKVGMKIAMFDIGGGTGICRIYKVLRKSFLQSSKKIAVFEGFMDCATFGRALDQQIMQGVEYVLRNEYNTTVENKLKLFEVVKEIKHELSTQDTITLNLSSFGQEKKILHEFTREWLEKLFYFNYVYFTLDDAKLFSNPDNKSFRCRRYGEFHIIDEQGEIEKNNVDIVFLAGGTCRIPFIRQKIKELFPKTAKIIIDDDELETITARGAVIHALQVSSGEVEPYINLTDYSDTEANEELDKKSANSNAYCTANEEHSTSDGDSNMDKETMTSWY